MPKLLVSEILPNLEMWEHHLQEMLADPHRAILAQVLVQEVIWVRRRQEMCRHLEMVHH